MACPDAQCEQIAWEVVSVDATGRIEGGKGRKSDHDTATGKEEAMQMAAAELLKDIAPKNPKKITACGAGCDCVLVPTTQTTRVHPLKATWVEYTPNKKDKSKNDEVPYSLTGTATIGQTHSFGNCMETPPKAPVEKLIKWL